ncbi:MAG: glycosyltransferase family 1 protein, partial [Candidatus Heimdallarchaeota archaeon]
EYRPDVIQHFTVKPVIYGTMAARILKINNIFNMVPGLGYVFTEKNIKRMLMQHTVRNLYKRTMGFSTHVFFQNNDDRHYFLRYKLVNEDKTSVIPGTGVDIDKFSPCKHERKKVVTFILAARMLWDKGIKEYVDAAHILRKKYNNVDFWLLGPVDMQNPKGISSEQLEKWSREGTVQYLGMTDIIKSYYEKADVIVLPSYYREGLPLSLLEGAAMGMPIITADSTGCREVVEDGINGYLVPIKNSIKLASAMEKFIVNPDLISRMGKASRRMAIQRFDSKKIVKEILKYYPF